MLAAPARRGAEVVLVSSGAIAAGLAPLGLATRPRALAAQQAAASVGQGLLVHRYTEELARHGLTAGQVLLTVDDVTRRSHYRNAYQTFAKLLELGVLPIVNENDTVATTEIRFGDNDRLAALVAHLVHADLLVLLSDVDGLYDGEPGRPGTALMPRGGRRRRPGVGADRQPGAAGLGSGGMQTKVDAARIAGGAGIPVVLTSADEAAAALAGDAGRHALPPDGQAPADPAAVAGPRHRAEGRLRPRPGRGPRRHRAAAPRCSPPASPASTGAFVAGDPVDLTDPTAASGRPRAGQLRRRRAARAARPVHPRPQARARGGVRA